MDEELIDDVERLSAEHADRPFGDVERVSGGVLQPFSLAGQTAAQNLLDKALRALEAGDTDRARRFAGRATRLPFDDHEKVAPAALESGMMLFTLVTDAAETAPEGDSRWLDAALQVLSAVEEGDRDEMRHVLAAMLHDYALATDDGARIREALRGAPERPALMDEDLAQDQLAERVLTILGQCREYRRFLASLPG